MNAMFQQLSDDLVKAREETRLTPEQVAVKIKMDLKFLLKMERGDFSFLPDIYLKAFLREYAKCVGLNEHTALQKFKSAKEGKPLDEKHEEPTVPKPEIPSSPKPPRLITDDHLQTTYSPEKKFPFTSNQLIGIAGGAVILFAVLIYWFVLKKEADAIVTERPYEEYIQENKERFEDETTQADSSLVAVASDSLVLSITSKDSSWLKVVADDNKVKEYFLYPNTAIEIKAVTKFSMTVGNPNVVKFTLNNQPLEFKPTSPRRQLIEITKKGITYIDQIPKQ